MVYKLTLWHKVQSCAALALKPRTSAIFCIVHKNVALTMYSAFVTLYGMHQLQLKRDMRGTRKGHVCYARVFLVIYTQLHAM